MQANLACECGIGSTIVNSFTFIPRILKVPVPMPVASLRLLVALEILACDDSVSIFVRAYAAALFIMALASIRFVQAQFSIVDLSNISKVYLTCIARQGKGTTAKSKRSTYFFVPTEGFTQGSQFLLPLREALSGVSSGCFLMRDSDSKSGDPCGASKWLNAPLRRGRRLEKAIKPGCLQSSARRGASPLSWHAHLPSLPERSGCVSRRFRHRQGADRALVLQPHGFGPLPSALP